MNQKKTDDLTRRLNEIIEREGIRSEVDKWIAAFDNGVSRLSPIRLAQHMKAALTGRALSKKMQANGLRVCDEINTLIGNRK